MWGFAKIQQDNRLCLLGAMLCLNITRMYGNDFDLVGLGYVAIMEQVLSARELCFVTISSSRATLSLNTTNGYKFLLEI